MTKEAFAEVVTVIERCYRITLDRETRRVWWEILRTDDVTDDQVRRNAYEYCRREHFPPVPADLVGGGGRHDAERDMAMAARVAWAQVMRAEHVADLRAIRALEAIGGRWAVLNTRLEDLGRLEERFVAHYLADARAGGAAVQIGSPRPPLPVPGSGNENGEAREGA